MTRCRVCNCKLKSGDICPRCEREQEWLNTPEYFCTSSNCQKLLPGATEPGLCAECKKLAEKPISKAANPPKQAAKIEKEIEKLEANHMEKTEKCNDCKAPITARRKSQSGLCERCFSREWARKKAQKAQTSTKTIPGTPVCVKCGRPDGLQKTPKGLMCGPCYMNKSSSKTQPEDGASTFAHKTGAEKSVCNETGPKVTQENSNVTFEPAADTIHASPPPKPINKIDEADVCRQAIHKHGISRQLAKAAEEFSEAAAAISRFLAGEGEYTEIIGEVADAEVMCVQMRLIYGTDSIEQVRAEKIARLHKRLNP